MVIFAHAARHVLIRSLFIAALAGAAFLVHGAWRITQDVDAVAARLSLDPGPQSTLIYDSKDRVMAALYREHRIPVMFEEMSDPLVQAALITEDRRFFEHGGVDLRRIVGAAVANLRRGRVVQGGSTITQQFVRGAFLDRSRTFGRKLREAWLARRLESKYSKQAILQAYLNQVYLGQGYYGVEAASLGYFAKPASQLNAAEAATIAALINRPSGYALRKTPSRIRDRRDWVLRQMHLAGVIDDQAFSDAVSRPVAMTLADPERRAKADPLSMSTGPYFAAVVNEMLFRQFGVETTLTGGLRVFTTLDVDVQRFAEQSVARRLSELEGKGRGSGDPLQAALVAIEPATGHVRAMVGGRNFVESPFNRAMDAKRQPGSAFKPFVFAAALEQGFSPGTTIDGLDAFIPSSSGDYLPGGEHEVESTTLRSALVHSSNRAAVHLLQRVGLGATIDLANRVGLDHLPAVPSLALGTGEVSLLDLTSAYTSFANGGVLQPPVFVRRVEGADGRVLQRGDAVGRRVLSESTAFLMASMLSDVVDRGTGFTARANGFRLPAGGKTGSTDGHADAWFIGFTPKLAAGVWIGFDRPQPIMRRGFASVVAVPAWARFMTAATSGSRAEWISRPPGVMPIRRCRASGGLATEYCELHGDVDDDLVSIGRSPDLCALHSSATAIAPAPSSMSLRIWPSRRE
jgi:penicillin-binding protein 1A